MRQIRYCSPSEIFQRGLLNTNSRSDREGGHDSHWWKESEGISLNNFLKECTARGAGQDKSEFTQSNKKPVADSKFDAGHSASDCPRNKRKIAALKEIIYKEATGKSCMHASPMMRRSVYNWSLVPANASRKWFCWTLGREIWDRRWLDENLRRSLELLIGVHVAPTSWFSTLSTWLLAIPATRLPRCV